MSFHSAIKLYLYNCDVIYKYTFQQKHSISRNFETTSKYLQKLLKYKTTNVHLRYIPKRQDWPHAKSIFYSKMNSGFKSKNRLLIANHNKPKNKYFLLLLLARKHEVWRLHFGHIETKHFSKYACRECTWSEA